MLSLYPGSTERYLPFLPLLYNNTHSRGPRLRAGVLCRSWGREFTKRSRGRHDFAKILGYPNIVPRKQRTIPPISPSPLQFTTTHSREPRPRAGAFCGPRNEKFTKRSRRRHDSAKILGYANTVPRKQRTISPISPSLLQHTQQRAPAPCRGSLSENKLKIHKSFTNRTRFRKVSWL